MSKAAEREKRFAKSLTFGERQVLAYLQRDDDDVLSVILALWVAASDEQLTVKVAIRHVAEEVSDRFAQDVFDSLDDERLIALFDELGVPAIIAEVEETGRDG